MTEYSPRDILDRTLRFWWILVALAILGGMAGWLFSLTRHPIYEATAVIEVSLDQQQLVEEGLVTVDSLPLDFAAQNVYLSAAANMFYSPEVQSRFMDDAQANGLNLEAMDFNSLNFILDRRGLEWFITVRSSDPVTAAQLANLWLVDTDAALSEAQAHGNQALSLKLQHDSIEKCFLEMDFTSANQCAGKTFTSPSDLDTYLTDLQQQIAAEQQAGQGIYPALSYVITGSANPPLSPILYATSLIILAGCLVGLLTGFIVTGFLPLPVREK